METGNQNTEATPRAPVVQVPVPNSQGILLLGIFSLVTTFCCGGIGLVGLVLGIIAVVMSSKAIETYQQNPRAYTESSYKNVNGGRICGIIGIILNGMLIVFMIFYLILVGGLLTGFFSSFPWEEYL
jgi:hypothetical protein